MEHLNPYQSPKVESKIARSWLELRFDIYLFRGALIGLTVGAAILPFHWLQDAVFLKDFAEDAVRDLGIGFLVGIVVGLVWGVITLARGIAPPLPLQSIQDTSNCSK